MKIPSRVEDLTGQTYGKLTAIQFIRTEKASVNRGRAVWLWRCWCSKEIEYPASFVKYQQHAAAKQSCGCWYKTKKHFGVDALINRVYVRHYKDGDLSFQDFKELTQQDCYYCGCQPSNKITNKKTGTYYIYNGLDRVDNKLPHNKLNCVSSCKTCNDWKSDWTQEEFYERAEKITQNRLKPNGEKL